MLCCDARECLKWHWLLQMLLAEHDPFNWGGIQSAVSRIAHEKKHIDSPDLVHVQWNNDLSNWIIICLHLSVVVHLLYAYMLDDFGFFLRSDRPAQSKMSIPLHHALCSGHSELPRRRGRRKGRSGCPVLLSLWSYVGRRGCIYALEADGCTPGELPPELPSLITTSAQPKITLHF